MRAPLSKNIAAAGILDRRDSSSAESKKFPGGDRLIADALGIRSARTYVTDEDLALLEASPATLLIEVDQLNELRTRSGYRYLVSGTAGVELVDVTKRWVIYIVVPLVFTFVTIPIPVNYAREPDQERPSLTTRVLDLETGHIVGTSVEVQLKSSSGGTYSDRRVKQVLNVMDLKEKHLRPAKESR